MSSLSIAAACLSRLVVTLPQRSELLREFFRASFPLRSGDGFERDLPGPSALPLPGLFPEQPEVRRSAQPRRRRVPHFREDGDREISGPGAEERRGPPLGSSPRDGGDYSGSSYEDDGASRVRTYSYCGSAGRSERRSNDGERCGSRHFSRCVAARSKQQARKAADREARGRDGPRHETSPSADDGTGSHRIIPRDPATLKHGLAAADSPLSELSVK